MKNKSIWNEMKPYLIISFGMLIYAFAATGFLVPHKIVGGGGPGGKSSWIWRCWNIVSVNI